MGTSGAAIVKNYLEKYVYINSLKTRKNNYLNPNMARISRAIAYNIIHEMEFLILSNQADDYGYIRRYLKEEITELHRELKSHQSFFPWLFTKTTLPSDFGRCVHEAWFELRQRENSD
ncbi:MAG: hypothetical protein H0U71_04330 [Gammaproteobacteria bacterium]|nr:hypothetical protein [Gammaproteobacteria bacterium]